MKVTSLAKEKNHPGRDSNSQRRRGNWTFNSPVYPVFRKRQLTKLPEKNKKYNLVGTKYKRENYSNHKIDYIISGRDIKDIKQKKSLEVNN